MPDKKSPPLFGRERNFFRDTVYIHAEESPLCRGNTRPASLGLIYLNRELPGTTRRVSIDIPSTLLRKLKF